MYIDTLNYDNQQWNLLTRQIEASDQAQLLLLFGDSEILKSKQNFEAIRSQYPHAIIVGASSSGNILGAEISKSPIVATAIQFEHGSVALSQIDFTAEDSVEDLSRQLIAQLPVEGLKHIFILSDGLNINGSELVRGINAVGGNFTVTGGMAGDGDRFLETWIVANEPARTHRIAAVGFYGEALAISTGCYAGWSAFGAERKITRSKGNILYELDHQPALALYKEYLGEFARDLPLSGMRFPLNIKATAEDNEVIRTLLAIDEATQSITFAGDVPEGYIARLMKPDLEVLIEGASAAAEEIEQINSRPALGLVVSCVGRRVVMKQIIEEELDAVEERLGSHVQLTGFYSYGEIAPFNNQIQQCQLHNQTMTLTAIYEQ